MDNDTKAFWILASFGFLMGYCALGVYFILIKPTSQNPKEPIKTEVVGQYKNCDIIRLNIPNDAKYHYTLYCENQK